MTDEAAAMPIRRSSQREDNMTQTPLGRTLFHNRKEAAGIGLAIGLRAATRWRKTSYRR